MLRATPPNHTTSRITSPVANEPGPASDPEALARWERD
jgi:hypothetical protein